uniref:Adhesion G protein-coupled receptor G3 n=1 Tax=Gopherus evgoodei TaxID=1825980 RepID=A0A8C4W1X1_9SAUR
MSASENQLVCCLQHACHRLPVPALASPREHRQPQERLDLRARKTLQRQATHPERTASWAYQGGTRSAGSSSSNGAVPICLFTSVESLCPPAPRPWLEGNMDTRVSGNAVGTGLLRVNFAGKRGGWNTSGCVTTLRDKETVCCCDHLTFFTLLMSPSLDVTVQMLLTIANVGCGISVVFSALTIILYFALRFAYKKFKSNDTAKIHVNLTSSLLLLNLAYLLNRWIFSLGHLGLCKGIGGFTHYCLLCSFTWMAIEAFQLYLLVIKVTNIYMRHYMVKLCLVGWGFPALVVTITGSMNSYGKYTITDMANQPTLTLCWIDSAHLVVHYVTNCSYFGLILLFNTLILVVVAWKLFCLQRATAGKEEKIEAWKGGLTVLGLSCLLGATWGLAFFTYGATSVPAVYLFTVLNSLQGQGTAPS